MEMLRGGPALSPFRLSRVLLRVQQKVSVVSRLQAEYRYFALLPEAGWNKAQHAVLETLLDASHAPASFRSGPLFLVVPRPGTVSPWSSKATDIAHNCGLTQIQRLERGIAWFAEVDRPLSDEEAAEVSRQLHDPMMEVVLAEEQQAARLFPAASPRPLGRIDVQNMGRAALAEANRELGLALSEEELEYLHAFFLETGRDPSDAELMMFAQANSEHCRHKVFNASWELDGQPQPHSLFAMIRNTWEKNGQGVLSAYSDNAAVMAGPDTALFFPDANTGCYGYIQEELPILMKVETHNHPTAIAPGPGAATGAGGEIRDEGATGCGGRPRAGLVGFSVSNLRIPGFVQPWEQSCGRPETIASALDIMIDGPVGAASFNNEFGRPALCGYFRTFEQQVPAAAGVEWRGYHKPIMVAGGLGNVRSQHVQKGALKPGSLLVVLGGPALEIGLGGGAASSSCSSQGQEALDFASVQRANPEMERRCQQVIDRCWQAGERNPVCFIHDVGAGGLSNALPELVNDGGMGGRLELRRIPCDDAGMSPLAIWCNESQERYVLAIAPENLSFFEAICHRERCPFAVVGEAVTEPHLLVTDDHHKNRPVDMPLDVLLGKPPRLHRNAQRLSVPAQPFDCRRLDLHEALERVLRLPAVADKGFLITIGDRSITGQVVRDQMVGPWQVPVADCSVTASGFRATTGEAMAMGERAPVALLDAPASGRLAVGEAITNIAAARIQRLADVRLSANWMAAVDHPGEDALLYDTVKAVGMALCPELGISIPVGKDSLSMQTAWQNRDGEHQKVTAPLSLVISAFAPVVDHQQCVTPALRSDQGDSELLLVDLGRSRHRMGASALAQVYGAVGDRPADLDNPADLAHFFQAVQTLLSQQKILAYHDRSDGGLIVTLLEMAFAGRRGLELDLSALVQQPDDLVPLLFNEELGAVLQIRQCDRDSVQACLAQFGLADAVHRLGYPMADQAIRVRFQGTTMLEGSRAHWQRIWSETSYQMRRVRDNASTAQQEFDNLLDSADPGLHAKLPESGDKSRAAPWVASGVRPRVAVLREQGVNGHQEMAAAFDSAGFEAVDVHMTDLAAGVHSLDDFRVLAVCGGFSYGDVLGAGQGWARSILFNPRLREAFASFFARPDTLTLGVCNGCQMLSGVRELIPGAEHWPRFVPNLSGQFEARLVMVEVAPSASVLLQSLSGARIPVAVAHGEGQVLFGKDADRNKLQAAGQLALFYTDNHGQRTERYPFNPNGSQEGLTGLCSRDGRVTIMMPHPERVFQAWQHSWAPEECRGEAPWQQVFHNARAWVG